MDLHMVGWLEDKEKRLKAILEDLLHEIIHGYFMIFSCGCEECASIKEDLKYEDGEVWQKIAKTIEEAVKEQLELELDLDRESYLAAQLLLDEEMLSAMIGELGLDEDQVRREMAHLRATRSLWLASEESCSSQKSDEELDQLNELKSKEFAENPEKLKCLVESVMCTENKWSIAWNEKDFQQLLLTKLIRLLELEPELT
jgi:hypothetical protein